MRISVADFIEDYLSPLTFVIAGVVTTYISLNYGYFWKGLATGFVSTWVLAMLLHFFPEWLKYPEWKTPFRIYQDCMAAIVPASVFTTAYTVVVLLILAVARR